MGNKAIIWDYDGTLADTREKNFNVTKRIMLHLLGVRSREYPTLQSLEQYICATRGAANWRELYRNEFGMNEVEIEAAGSLWTDYQLSDDTGTAFFEGIEEVLQSLGSYPNLIFSQNSRNNIVRVLEGKGLLRHFQDIIGYEEVPSSNQKPAPDGLLLCISKIAESNRKYIFFIGDHETDALCGHNANVRLGKISSEARVINVAALYGSNEDTSAWAIRPDHVVRTPREISKFVHSYS